MRQPTNPIWERWRSDDVKIPLGWVTVEPDWWLTSTDYTNPEFLPGDGPTQQGRRRYPVIDASGGSRYKGPFRWFQSADNDQTELLVPGVRSVSWERSVESTAATCQIVLSNQMLDPNGFISGRARQPFGNLGALTPHRGGARFIPAAGSTARWSAGQLMADALWGHEHNEWFNELVPNALFRVYEGYADPANPNPTFAEARAAGDVVLTGVWIADTPKFPSSGVITIPCRDMSKLLVDQTLYPPLIPSDQYPLRYLYESVTSQLTTSTTPVLIDAGSAGAGFDAPPQTSTRRARRSITYKSSSSDLRFGGTNADVVAGGVAHRPTHANDNAPNSYWLSEGYQGATMPYGTVWIEWNVGGQSVSAVDLETWGSGYVVYVSVKVNGVWQGKRKVPYSGGLDGATTGAGIKFVTSKKLGRRSNSANASAKGIISLGKTWSSVEAVRISFRNLHKSPWGPLYWRAGLRQLYILGPGSTVTTNEWVPPTYADMTNYNVVTTRGPGNYSDYSQIIKQLLLWSGFYLLPPANGRPYNQASGEPQVYGNIESTGAYAEQPLPADMFDKRPVMDAITTIKNIVGYYFWVGEEGEAHFESPNWWRPGNFDEFGNPINFMPEFDEDRTLFDYEPTLDASSARSKIVVAASDPDQDLGALLTKLDTPVGRDLLRGMSIPAMWINKTFLNRSEQQRMVELIALHIFMSLRQGRATIAANPLLSPNDQARIFERVSAESSIHYIRGLSSSHDFISGDYEMVATTAWLGDRENWAIRRSDGPSPRNPPTPYRTYTVGTNETWDRIRRRVNGRYEPETFNIARLQELNAAALAETDGELVKGMRLVIG